MGLKLAHVGQGIISYFNMEDPVSIPVASRYGVRSLPTVVLLDGDEMYEMISGQHPDHTAEFWMEKVRHWTEGD